MAQSFLYNHGCKPCDMPPEEEGLFHSRGGESLVCHPMMSMYYFFEFSQSKSWSRVTPIVDTNHFEEKTVIVGAHY